MPTALPITGYLWQDRVHVPKLGSRRLIDEQHQKIPFISFYLSLLGRWQVYSKYLLSS